MEPLRHVQVITKERFPYGIWEMRWNYGDAICVRHDTSRVRVDGDIETVQCVLRIPVVLSSRLSEDDHSDPIVLNDNLHASETFASVTYPLGSAEELPRLWVHLFDRASCMSSPKRVY